jgi:hypothetical protein
MQEFPIGKKNSIKIVIYFEKIIKILVHMKKWDTYSAKVVYWPSRTKKHAF